MQLISHQEKRPPCRYPRRATPLTPQGPGSHTGLPIDREESSLLTRQSRIFATWDPATLPATGITLSNGNLTATHTDDDPPLFSFSSVRATIGLTDENWYWELTIAGVSSAGNNGAVHGVEQATLSPTSFVGSTLLGSGWQSRPGGFPLQYRNGVGSGFVTGNYVPGDVIGIALTMAGGVSIVEFFYAGVLVAFFANTGPGTYYPAASLGNDVLGQSVIANFGQTAFTYNPRPTYNQGVYVDI